MFIVSRFENFRQVAVSRRLGRAQAERSLLSRGRLFIFRQNPDVIALYPDIRHFLADDRSHFTSSGKHNPDVL